jgi:altronate dehydratase
MDPAGNPGTVEFEAVGRLPAPGDNVAIALSRIEAGARVVVDGVPRAVAGTILEGHRFAVRPIARGAELLSWGRPFGIALRDIEPGEYVCNRAVLEILSKRNLAGASLPPSANFEDRVVPYFFDESAFRPGCQVDPAKDAGSRFFPGFPRPGDRGAGTRNTIVILGVTSRAAAYARQLAERLQPLARVFPALDGIVAVAHTEGDGREQPNNREELLRTLAGFMVHPNVGAVLAVDYGVEAVHGGILRDFMARAGYPLGDVPHRFLTIRTGLAAALAEGEAVVRGWLPTVGVLQRVPVPLARLRVALQCGGSDAFSGVSANPLVGIAGRHVVRYGGSVNLAETDELVGAESYILANARDSETARRFLGMISRFKERLSWHGSTVEGNPSGGNRLRGLYNIVLKSLGAAMKKDPAVRLDQVIDYAEPTTLPGFAFMNSPGNDLEGIAGQVAAGCTMILFTTGNGSVTNFPFVPTVKVTSTSRRHRLLANEMDFNAGAYLDGTPMEQLGEDLFSLMQEVAGGRRTLGERAGHNQVSIWRNWRQRDTSRLAELRVRPLPDGRPLAIVQPPVPYEARAFPAFRTPAGAWASDRVGLVLPTSLCSSQIARLAAQRLNETSLGRDHGISRFVALPHTEGCGFAGETMYALLRRTYSGYVSHPSVAAALFLEHGCEKIVNDVMRHELAGRHLDAGSYGWASVQLDGGIAKTLDGIEAWFGGRLSGAPAAARTQVGLGALTLGILSDGPVRPSTAAALGSLAQMIVSAGGSLLLVENDAVLREPRFLAVTLGGEEARATLSYGEPVGLPGFHVVRTESEQWVENVAGLGGCGALVILGVVSETSRPGHPFVPVLQLAEAGTGRLSGDDVDGFLCGVAEQDLGAMLQLVLEVAGGGRRAAADVQGNVDFQLTRGLLGVST